MDREIHGGEQWWREIIRTIQEADVFVFALSQDSWTSQPCREELDYAQRLGLPVLPVQVGSVESVRIPIMETQGVDYRERTANAALGLVAALTELTSRPVVRADPPPEPPKVPFEYLYRIAEILGPTPIAPDRQEAVIVQLRRKLKEERDVVARADIVKLLREFRRRKELTVGNSEEIDQLLDAAGETEQEDGATRLPPTDHWRRNLVAQGASTEAPRPDGPTRAVETPRPGTTTEAVPPSRPTPRKPPRTPPPPAPTIEVTREPAYDWGRAQHTKAPAETASSPAPPPWTTTEPETPPVSTPRPPTAGWWNARKVKAEEPDPPPPTDSGLAFAGGVLGGLGIPFGILALTEHNRTATQVALSLLLIASVLGLSLGLVAVNRGERRSQVAAAIAAAGLLGAVLFALSAF